MSRVCAVDEPLPLLYAHRDHSGEIFTIRNNARIPVSVSGAYVLTAQRTDRATVYVGMSRRDLIELRDALNAALAADQLELPLATG
jgi:hypothetical protein